MVADTDDLTTTAVPVAPEADPRLAQLEDAVDSLADLETGAVATHAARYHAVHRVLQDALADAPLLADAAIAVANGSRPGTVNAPPAISELAPGPR